LYNIVHHAAFDIVIASCIAVNMLVMCAAFSEMPDDYAAVIEWINFAFVIIFTIELALKLFAMGFVRFFGLRLRCGLEKVRRVVSVPPCLCVDPVDINCSRFNAARRARERFECSTSGHMSCCACSRALPSLPSFLCSSPTLFLRAALR
jgi:hypothetical protein